jgi:hypothetical protein
MNKPTSYQEAWDAFEANQRSIADLEAKLETARAALEPFAEVLNAAEEEAGIAAGVGGYIPLDLDELNIVDHFPGTITVGDLKRATHALAQIGAEKAGPSDTEILAKIAKDAEVELPVDWLHHALCEIHLKRENSIQIIRDAAISAKKCGE